MNRKLWSNEEKVAIILEILRGDESAAICSRHGVSATQAYRWLERFLEGGRKALSDKRTRRGRDPVLDENRQGAGQWPLKCSLHQRPALSHFR